MAPKRRRNASILSKGLLPGKHLNRNVLPSSFSPSPWAWVGNDVLNAADITLENRLASCNLSSKKQASCPNKYPAKVKGTNAALPRPSVPTSSAEGELQDDIIVISDNEEPECSNKTCKTNPNCLNYLGQQAWQDADGPARDAFFRASNLSQDPSLQSRNEDLPVGLKNLGATCYANASLQVWYRDLVFRSGLYSCEPPENVTEEKYKESPIFQLQVTFAALQEGNKSVFNPKNLVESLQLRTSEQQDAQEFSKLFMSHLDAEFKKQSSPVTKTLITDQFQGTQIYGTICHACKNRSERVSDFLELEISFTGNCKLEDRLEASLLPEKLTGDNKYFCSRCEALQDATRYTELRELPPVLHFSLLRFVYDINTMERKKSKNSISFPSNLDMGKFVGSKNTREKPNGKSSDSNLYELRGILLHKGASAYHGHYEAQVYDIESKSWFQFNDDEVTRIEVLGDKAPAKKMTTASYRSSEEAEENPKPSQLRKDRMNARKKRRIEDSDDEVAEVKKNPSLNPLDNSNIISSKDAYMLIYARKSPIPGPSRPSSDISMPKPPVRAMEVIRELNGVHNAACEMYKNQSLQVEAHFQRLRHKVQDIYSRWTDFSDPMECAIVSKHALEIWLSEGCIKAASPQVDAEEFTESDSNSTVISIVDIVCEHGALDPMKSKEMKCISLDIFHDIIQETNCEFDPLFKPSDICAECVSDVFTERLYTIDHPKTAKRFEEISFCPEDEEGFWISKKWVKDWKLNKPRMHTPSQPDPEPDSSEFRSHVICDHGALSTNTTHRRKISVEAMELLKSLFPNWQPLPSDTKTCAVCSAEIYISREDKKESRKRVEDEKARLKFIYEPTLDSWTNTSNVVSYAIIPSSFIKKWNRWITNPCASNPRPDSVDNGPFFCDHNLLGFDPNCPSDIDSTITIIQLDQWDTLGMIYSAGPLISLTKKIGEEGDGYDHEIAVCVDCRFKRKYEWDSTDVVLRLCNRDHCKKDSAPPRRGQITYAHINEARQSKRLRQNKDRNERRTFRINRTTTVKALKMMANQEFGIPTICQRLFYRGKELDDNAETFSKFKFLANDVIELREAEDVQEVHGSDSDEPRPSKKRREGPAFGGTLLGNVDSSWSSSPEPAPLSTPPSLPSEEKACIACTFSNNLQALSCEMCDTPFF
ncbi:cysteine proteinase [Pholiota conissans]|uniref:ubiquitinyl hydrolase 1 n=1 Tax=Pholiota conissans TaxID=109636 RepID=A0A9P5YWH7_9AGAR|nr:cysteine proteinase [Pholiota conissans]